MCNNPTRRMSLPKMKIMEDPMVVALLTKRVSAAQTEAHKAAMRRHRDTVKSAKEAIGTVGLERKLQKAVTDAVVAAITENAPVAAAAE